jgi:hypothetical protein
MEGNMVRTNRFALVSVIAILGLLIASCGVLQTPATPSEDFINTSVAQTVNAQIPATDEPALTETPAPQLTEAPAETETPPLAPLAVAFVSPDHNAYYWNESLASPTQLTTSNDVQQALVSPDGTKVVLVRSTDWISYSLDVINADASGLRNLVLPANFAALPRPADTLATIPSHVSWMPDSLTIAMTTRIAYEGPGGAAGESLFLINSNTSAMSTLLTIASEWNWDYTFSPDASLIAISRPEGMDIYNGDGSLLIADLITFPFVNTASEYAWIPDPVWSPDGTALVVVVPPQDPWSFTPADSKVYQWNTTDASAVLRFTAVMSYWPMEIASIAPDLSKLLYLVQDGDPMDNRHALTLVNVDGSGSQVIDSGELYNLPEWSTDAGRFYYYSNAGQAYIVEPGSAPVGYPAYYQVRDVKWVDPVRFIGVSGPVSGWQLFLGSVSAPAVIIFAGTTGDDQIQFTTNR